MLDACRPLEDLRVSITGGVHFDLVKRVLRDINRSGQAPEEIIQQVKTREKESLLRSPQEVLCWSWHHYSPLAKFVFVFANMYVYICG